MRNFLIAVALLAASGCSTNPSMAMLYDEALATGDWSAVEFRERRMASEAALSACLRSNGRRYCVDDDCKCISAQQMRRMLQPDPGPWQ